MERSILEAAVKSQNSSDSRFRCISNPLAWTPALDSCNDMHFDSTGRTQAATISDLSVRNHMSIADDAIVV